jgi:hypothetical protein
VGEVGEGGVVAFLRKMAPLVVAAESVAN